MSEATAVPPRRLSRRFMAMLVVVALVLVGPAIWTAVGPTIVHACPAPAVAPSELGWLKAGDVIGNYNGQSDIRGSTATWRSRSDGAELTIYLMPTADEGDFGGGESVTAHGQPALMRQSLGSDIPAFRVDWREPGTAMCLDYQLRLEGADVTPERARTLVAGLRS